MDSAKPGRDGDCPGLGTRRLARVLGCRVQLHYDGVDGIPSADGGSDTIPWAAVAGCTTECWEEVCGVGKGGQPKHKQGHKRKKQKTKNKKSIVVGMNVNSTLKTSPK